MSTAHPPASAHEPDEAAKAMPAPSKLVRSQLSMSEPLRRSTIEAALLVRPIERKLASFAVSIAAAVSLLFFTRELYSSSYSQQFVAALTVSCLGIALATAVAVPREDSSFCPVWEPLVYVLLVATAAVVPLIGRWATIQGYGADPAMLPGLMWFICIMSPFAVSNQSAFGLGSALPKCVVMAAAVRYSLNGDWGIFAAHLLTTPQSAMLALGFFSLLASASMIFLKRSYSNTLMMALGLIATVPAIVLLDRLVVMLQLA